MRLLNQNHFGNVENFMYAKPPRDAAEHLFPDTVSFPKLHPQQSSWASLCGMKYKGFQECRGDGNVHVWEIIGRSSQTRVTRTACIDKKRHYSHDTAPRRILEECSVYGMTTGSIPHSATAQKTCQWKILHSRTRKFAATDHAFPFSHYHSRKKYVFFLAMTNRLFEHEGLFYEEAEGSNSHSYFSMFLPHGLNSSLLGTA